MHSTITDCCYTARLYSFLASLALACSKIAELINLMKESTQVGDDSLLNETLGLEQIISTCLCGLMRAFCNLNKAWLQTSQAFWRSTLMGHKFASWDFFLRFFVFCPWAFKKSK